jgi:hypothetical protein
MSQEASGINGWSVFYESVYTSWREFRVGVAPTLSSKSRRTLSGTGFSLFAFELYSDSDERQKKTG